MKRVFAHIGFSAALTLFALNIFGLKLAYIVIPIMAVVFAFSLIFKKTRQAVAVPLSFGTAILACLIFVLVSFANCQPQVALDKQTANATFQIVDLPEKTENGYAYVIKTKQIELDKAPQNIKLRLKSDNLIDAQPYDDIYGELTFYSIGNSPMGSYGHYGENIFLSSKSYDEFKVISSSKKPVNYYVLKLRSYIKTTVSSFLKDDYGAVITGLLIGDKSSISVDTVNSFNSSGTSHLMSVSGLHTSVLGFAIYWIFKKLRFKESPSVILTVLILCIYVALAGFSKSVIRATIMISIMLIGKLFKRKSDGLNSLGFATFIICLNPFAMSDISAIMSILATLSILTVRPFVYKNFVDRINIKNLYIKKAVLNLINSLLITLCVIVVTLPASYIYFGYFSISSVVANLFVVPVGSLLLYLSSLMILFSKVPVLNYTFAYLSGFVSKILINIVHFFGSLSFATINIDEPVVSLMILGVLIIFAVSIVMNNKTAIKLASILCVLIVIITSVFNAVVYKNAVTLKVLKTSGGISVLAYNDDYIFASGIGDYNSFYELKNSSRTSNKDFRLLIVPSYNENDCNKVDELTENTNISNILVPYNDESVYNTISAKNIVQSNTLVEDVWNDFTVQYNYNENGYFIVLNIYDKKIIINDGCNLNNEYADLYITNQKGINSANGDYVVVSTDENVDYNNPNVETTISGDICFTIMENKSFSVRRCFYWDELAN